VSVSVVNEADVKKEYYNSAVDAIDTAVSKLLPGAKYNIVLTLCENSYIKELNNKHRGIDDKTDVLSFPMLESIAPGEVIVNEYDKDPENQEIMLGDIVISFEKAKEQSEDFGHSLERELCYLAVHSVLHLFGYDHINENDKKIMRIKEEEILSQLGVKR
jgi:probable rRNA maturation factor